MKMKALSNAIRSHVIGNYASERHATAQLDDGQITGFVRNLQVANELDLKASPC